MSRYIDADALKPDYFVPSSSTGTVNTYYVSLFQILNAPTADVMGWIPVTERLPKPGEKVLVSTKNTVFTQVFKRIYGTPDHWGWEHNTIKKVTAWMPLPEPYKEKKENAEIH